MQALVNGHRLINAVKPISKIEAGRKLSNWKLIRTIAVNLIRARETKRRVPAEIAGGDKKVQRPNGVDIEIVIRDRGCFIMRRLSRRVNNEIGPRLFQTPANPVAIANIQIEMTVIGNRFPQVRHDGLRISLRTEEYLALIVIDADYIPALLRQDLNARRADQAAGSGNKCSFHRTLGVV